MTEIEVVFGPAGGEVPGLIDPGKLFPVPGDWEPEEEWPEDCWAGVDPDAWWAALPIDPWLGESDPERGHIVTVTTPTGHAYESTQPTGPAE